MKVLAIKYMKLFIINLLCILSLNNTLAFQEFNVKEFGAVGDGKTDDTRALFKCFNKARQSEKSKIIIPYGIYIISKSIELTDFDNSMSIHGISYKNKLPLIKTTKPITIFKMVGTIPNKTKGEITINGLNLKSINYPFSKVHPFINKDNRFSGIYIANKKYVTIQNCIIQDFYGEGININNYNQMDCDISQCFDEVNITNCKILNCWGFNPLKDDYGDGIYISNTLKGNISNNKIINNLSECQQFGRCGICIEYMCENLLVNNNVIQGYDRGIHIEMDYGNHIISYNTISHTDLALCTYCINIPNHNNPIKIEYNLFTNYGLPKNNNFSRTRGIDHINNRPLLDFVALDNCRAKSNILKNKFIVYGNYDYFSDSYCNIRGDNVVIRGNTYQIKNQSLLNKKLGYFVYSKAFIHDEIFENVQTIFLAKINHPDKATFFKSNVIKDMNTNFYSY